MSCAAKVSPLGHECAKPSEYRIRWADGPKLYCAHHAGLILETCERIGNKLAIEAIETPATTPGAGEESNP